MASNKANGSRLSRLLVDKGTQALRATFNAKHPPATLTAVLNTNKPKLQKLRYKVISTLQWKLLYPSYSPPDSQNFDVTLLTILLREICGLTSPTTGWNIMPPDTDTSVAANILRIKLYRNEIYAHIASTEVDDNTFENLWKKIANALISLGIPSCEMDELKEAPLSPEEDSYIQQLVKWKAEEGELVKISLETNAAVKEIQKKIKVMDEKFQEEVKLRQEMEGTSCSDIYKLGKCDFRGNIRSLSESFQTGTRTWLFEKLDKWFTNSDSRVMVLTAGPGVGKSVFAAKLCQLYEQSGRLAACHFCKYNNSDYRNPHMLLQSLASHMCDNVEGFKEKLTEQLRRPHSRESLPDAFRVLLNDPLYALEEREPMLIVIDALDESEVKGKSELLELISEVFSNLPKWIKIFITSRPELQVQKELSHLNPVEVRPVDENNYADLFHYLKSHLPDSLAWYLWLPLLATQCEGSFLYAYYLQLELLHKNKPLDFCNAFWEKFVPKGISGFYEKQFKRLKVCLAPFKFQFKSFLNVLVAAQGPLPVVLLLECMGLPKNTDYELRREISEVTSPFLPIYDDCLTVYHKSLIDWLKSSGYNEHAFTADVKDGARQLWSVCERVFNEIVCLETFSDLKLTPVVKYALKYGTSLLNDVGDENKYHWLVDVKLNHVKETIFPLGLSDLYLELWEISDEIDPKIGAHIQGKIWLHLNNCRLTLSSLTGIAPYLQDVANGLTAFNNEERDRRTAKLILEKESRYVWCEDLNTTRNSSNHLLASWFNENGSDCVGISPNKQLAAIGHWKGGTISILKMPGLEFLYKYNTEISDRIPCCTFSPDNSVVLYGRLASCLDVEHRKIMSFFPYCSEQFVSCSFSPSGGRLVTADNTTLVKLWDVNDKILLTALDSGAVVDNCFFSSCGLFIVGNTKNSKTESYVLAIWNVFTLQRMDEHSLAARTGNLELRHGIAWVCHDKVSVQNLQIVESRGLYVTLFSQLPRGLQIGFFEAPNKFASVVKVGNQDSILIYVEENQSFITVDPVQRSNVAERRIHWLPADICDFPVVVDEDSFIIQSDPYIFSIKTPDELLFLSPICAVTITCCAFSPNGLCLATCDDHGLLRIWSVTDCKVMQTYTWKESPIACWWSKTCLWLVFSTCVAKIPVTGGQTFKFSEVETLMQECFCNTEFTELLSFSESVLVWKSDSLGTIFVTKIVDDELQPWTVLPTDHSFDCAAIGPGGCSIFLASSAKYQLWKETQSTNQVWRISFNVDVDYPFADDLRSRVFSSSCCMTSDGLFGVIVFSEALPYPEPVILGFDYEIVSEDLLTGRKFCLGYLVVDLGSGKLINDIWFPEQHFLYHDLLHQTSYASRSFLVFQDVDSCFVYIVRLKDGEIVAAYRRKGRAIIKSSTMPILGFSSRHNLLAIPQTDGYINFVKVHSSEGI